MAILTFPNIIPDTQDFGITYYTQVTSTSLTQVVNTVELPGARWSGRMQFRDLNPTAAAELKAFLLSLRGMSGRFYYGDLELTAPQDDTLSGTLTVQAGSTARIIEHNAPSGGVFTVGDRIQIGANNDPLREYKMVVDVYSPNTIIIEPMLRRTDYVNKSIIYNNPTGVFMLDADTYGKWNIRSKAKLSDLSIGFIEAFT